MSFTSQNYSVGKPKRMDRVLADCAVLSVGVSLLIGVGAWVFGSQVLRIYTTDGEVIQCGLEILSITTGSLFPVRHHGPAARRLRGMGHSAVPMVLSIIGTVGVRILWFMVFSHSTALCISCSSPYPGSWIATNIMQAVCFWFVRKKCHRQLQDHTVSPSY